MLRARLVLGRWGFRAPVSSLRVGAHHCPIRYMSSTMAQPTRGLGRRLEEPGAIGGAPTVNHQSLKPRDGMSSETKILRNARYNDAGEPYMLFIKDSAARQLQKVNANGNGPLKSLRVLVDSGGCHGFQFRISMTTEVDPDEDTVFGRDGVQVVMDSFSLPYANGSKVEYSTELIGSSFKVVDNPNAKSTCGCDVSFELRDDVPV